VKRSQPAARTKPAKPHAAVATAATLRKVIHDLSRVAAQIERDTGQPAPATAPAGALDNLRRLADAVGHKDLARLAQASPSYLSRVLNGKEPLRPSYPRNLEKRLELPPLWFDTPDQTITTVARRLLRKLRHTDTQGT
jgi:transcriptional regulator with XRE-family HTH domain